MSKILVRSLFLVALCSTIGRASAQEQAGSSYRGIYVTGAPLIDARRELPDAVYKADWIKGIYIRLVWATIEPQQGRYDFSTLDNELDRAVAARKRVSLSVIAGGRAPNWLQSAGVRTVAMMVGRGGGANRACVPFSFGVPWDPTYQKAFIAMQQAVAAHIRARPDAWAALRIVKLTGMNQITEEMRVPVAVDERFDDCGNTDRTTIKASLSYTPDAAVGAWVALAKGVASAFPGKILALDILERNDFPQTDRMDAKSAIVDEALQLFPGRFAIQWDGLNLGGPTSNAALGAARRGAILGWQSNAFRGLQGAGCNAARRDEARACDPAGYRALLQRGVADGARYIEIWAPDALAFGQAVGETERDLQAGQR